MVLAAARPRASGMEIIVTARGQRKLRVEKAHSEIGLAVMFGRTVRQILCVGDAHFDFVPPRRTA